MSSEKKSPNTNTRSDWAKRICLEARWRDRLWANRIVAKSMWNFEQISKNSPI